MTLTKDNLYNVWEKSSDELAEKVGMLKLLILLFFKAATVTVIYLPLKLLSHVLAQN